MSESEANYMRKWAYAEKLLTVLANKVGLGMVGWCKWCENTSDEHHESCALNEFLKNGTEIEFDVRSQSNVNG